MKEETEIKVKEKTNGKTNEHQYKKRMITQTNNNKK